ncbi:DUF6148 family protein [Nitrosomonas sp. Nm34]|uniref:DUF6148 family protein n=1 Tax=Nitrosomonas sp. Nm34 TaxID=1881055 RepID=UPI0008E252FB|nr:DUF6148 family protein [Nitrosomonas sp. Nm34]SFI31285.1 hypothetical protein SAMN05428978_100562 [Nitrosomonas sp. Nm34]
MAGITLEQAEAELDRWMEANKKVASGQSYEIDGRRLDRVNAKEIREQITYWNGMVKDLSVKARGRSRSANVSPGW